MAALITDENVTETSVEITGRYARLLIGSALLMIFLLGSAFGYYAGAVRCETIIDAYTQEVAK